MSKRKMSKKITGRRRLKLEGRLSKHKLAASAQGDWFDGLTADQIQEELLKFHKAGRLVTTKHSPNVVGTRNAKNQTVLSAEQVARLEWDLSNRSFGVKVLLDTQTGRHQLGLWNQTVLNTVAASGLLLGVPTSTHDHLRVVDGQTQGVHTFGLTDAELASGRFVFKQTLRARPKRRRP